MSDFVVPKRNPNVGDALAQAENVESLGRYGLRSELDYGSKCLVQLRYEVIRLRRALDHERYVREVCAG